MTVAVRGLATKDIDNYNMLRTIRREVLVGLLNGIFFAVLIGVISAFWFSNPSLGYIIGIAMIINMFCAALAGILIPIFLEKISSPKCKLLLVLIFRFFIKSAYRGSGRVV